MKTNSSTPEKLYLGLDVQKAETVIAILESDREAEPRHYGTVTTSQHALERAMRRIAKNQGRKLSEIHVCYEASGCGFWIARRLNQMGCRCEVIAPSLIPTRSGNRVKTDKRDAMKLAKSLRSNDLVAVNVPDATDEAIREAVAGLPCDVLIDGEAVGDTLHAFDLLEADRSDLRRCRYLGRHSALLKLLPPGQLALRWVSTAIDPDDKAEIYEDLRYGGCEGVVCKDINAPFSPGRPSSGGAQLKFKPQPAAA